MKAYLEKIGGDWLDDFVYISKYPLSERGYKIIAFDGDDMENTLSNKSINPKTDICIGSVQATEKFFELCGIPIPESISYPTELVQFLGRRVFLTTIKGLTDLIPIFAKPAEEIKKFTGDVIQSEKHILNLKIFDKCVDETLVYASDIMEFVTEYRVFVSHGKIYGMKHYKGNEFKMVDYDKIMEMVDAYKNCPSAYTLDVGLNEKGETLLVEVNDMWAIGSYGLDGRTYALLCARRMNEISKTAVNAV